LAQEYDLPITVVVFNNQRYLSMERACLNIIRCAAKKTGVHFGGPIIPIPTTVCMRTSMAAME
jgi:hypothetical protein